jgi:hypothetical protein
MAQLQDPGFPELPNFNPIIQGLKDARISANARMEMEAHLETKKAVEANKRAIIAQTQGASILFNQAMTPAQSGANRAVMGFTAMALLPGVAESGLSSPAALSSVLAQGMLQPGMPQQARSIVGNINDSMAMPDAEISNWFDMHSRGEMRSVSMSQLMHMAKTDGKYGELARRYLSTELTPEAKATAAQLFTSPLMGGGEMIAFDDAGNVIGGQQLREYRAMQQFMVSNLFDQSTAEAATAHRSMVARRDYEEARQAHANRESISPQGRRVFNFGADALTGQGVAPTADGYLTDRLVQGLAPTEKGFSDTEYARHYQAVNSIEPSFRPMIQQVEDIGKVARLQSTLSTFKDPGMAVYAREVVSRAIESKSMQIDDAIRHTQVLHMAEGDPQAQAAYLKVVPSYAGNPSAAEVAALFVRRGIPVDVVTKEEHIPAFEKYFSRGEGRRFAGMILADGVAFEGDMGSLLTNVIPWQQLGSDEPTDRSVAAIRMNDVMASLSSAFSDGIVSDAEIQEMTGTLSIRDRPGVIFDTQIAEMADSLAAQEQGKSVNLDEGVADVSRILGGLRINVGMVTDTQDQLTEATRVQAQGQELRAGTDIGGLTGSVMTPTAEDSQRNRSQMTNRSVRVTERLDPEQLRVAQDQVFHSMLPTRRLRPHGQR